MNKILFLLVLVFTKNFAQSFPPQVGISGTTAIHKDDIVFVDWANNASITLGYQNITNVSGGLTDFGLPVDATGIANGTIISLGDNGEAILSFNHPIVNGNGFDFAVFENGFLEETESESAFLELAFVEVSTDGIDYVRFPAITELNQNNQIDSFGFINARYVHNFAGKYINNYGTPFDLEDLTLLISGTTVDLNNINYIKIIDVIGTVNANYATYDSQNNIVNDPYPTEFSSGGFDLDAIGVIHNSTTSNISDLQNYFIQIYPNPVSDILYIKSNFLQNFTIKIFSLKGKLVFKSTNNSEINLKPLAKGVYILKLTSDKDIFIKKILKN